MPSQTLTPNDVAQALGVNVQTIRRWTAAHAAHLSQTAGRAPRRLTPRDVEVLGYVATLRAQGYQTAAINVRLAATQFPDEVETDSQGADAQRIATQPRLGQDAPQLPGLVVDLLREEIAAVRLQAGQAQRQVRDRTLVFLYGIGLGAVGAMLLFWAAYLLARLAR